MKIINPLRIFSAEVWTLILENLSDGKDLLSAHATCNLWKEILERDFPKLTFPVIFPTLFKYLPKSDILNSRLVCKRWNLAIEHFLEVEQPILKMAGTHPLCSEYGDVRSLEVDINEAAKRLLRLHDIPYITQFATASQLFEKYFGSKIQSKNPFLSRSVHLYLWELDNSLLDLLEVHGKHIWYLKMYLRTSRSGDVTPPLELVQYLWRVLSYVPNLKKLSLVASHGHSIKIELQNNVERALQITQVDNFVSKSAPPLLSQLTNLELFVSVASVKNKLEEMCASRLVQYAHLGRQPFSAPEQFLKLRHLTFSIWFTEKDVARKLETLKHLKKNCPSDIQEMYVNVLLKPHVPKLFETLELFRYSLKHLTLCWAGIEQVFPVRLNLPNLRELTLEIGGIHFPYLHFGFLTNLQMLTHLKCIFFSKTYETLIRRSVNYQQSSQQQGKVRRKVNEMVDLHMYLEDATIFVENSAHGEVFRSNIWRLVKSLDSIHMCLCFYYKNLKSTRIYTRDELNNSQRVVTSQKSYLKTSKVRNPSNIHNLL